MKVTIYTTENCQWCTHSKKIMSERGIEFDEILIGKDISKKEFKKKYNADTAPLIYYGDRRIGGAVQLWEAIYSTNIIPIKISAIDQLFNNK